MVSEKRAARWCKMGTMCPVVFAAAESEMQSVLGSVVMAKPQSAMSNDPPPCDAD